jgi:hypothetical protein
MAKQCELAKRQDFEREKRKTPALRPGFLVRFLARQRHSALHDFGMMIAIKKAAAGVPIAASKSREETPKEGSGEQASDKPNTT